MKKSNQILTVTLNPSIDKVLSVDRLRPGQEHRVREISCSPGGKGINVARALRKFGIPTMTTGFAGGTAGSHFLQMLAKEKISGAFVKVSGEARTNVTITDGRAASITRFLENGPRVGKRDVEIFVKKFAGLLPGYSGVVFSGRNIPGADVDVYRRLIEFAQRSGKMVLLDTSGPELQAALKAKPFLVKPNLEEAEFLTGRRLRSFSQCKSVVRWLQHQGIPMVILSLGKKGIVAGCGQEMWSIVPPAQQGITVGCGDVLLAGFLCAHLRGKTFVESLQFAVAAAAANVGRLRPGDFSTNHLQRIKKQLKMKRL